MGGEFGCVRTMRIDPQCVNELIYTQFHDGLDLIAPVGTSVKSMYSGKVWSKGWSNSLGNYVTCEYSKIDGSTILVQYIHLASITIANGDIINTGDEIGKSGMTGNASNPGASDSHVHIIVFKNGEYNKDDREDPKEYINLY